MKKKTGMFGEPVWEKINGIYILLFFAFAVFDDGCDKNIGRRDTDNAQVNQS